MVFGLSPMCPSPAKDHQRLCSLFGLISSVLLLLCIEYHMKYLLNMSLSEAYLLYSANKTHGMLQNSTNSQIPKSLKQNIFSSSYLQYKHFYAFITFTHSKQFSSSLSTMGQTPSCLPSYCRHAHIQTNRCQNLANIMLSLNKWIKHCSSNFCCAVE